MKNPCATRKKITMSQQKQAPQSSAPWNLAILKWIIFYALAIFIIGAILLPDFQKHILPVKS